jgi:predicted DNA-binding protein YlxM (UPF0122 family)
VNDIARESLLFDFYGELLTDKKRRVMELYHEENLTLSEIAEETGVSRAAVHDSLKSAERKLEEYEEKLGMVERLAAEEKAFRGIRKLLTAMEKDGEMNQVQRHRLDEIRRMLTELERIRDGI